MIAQQGHNLRFAAAGVPMAARPEALVRCHTVPELPAGCGSRSRTPQLEAPYGSAAAHFDPGMPAVQDVPPEVIATFWN